MSKPFSIESIKGYPREECEIAQKIMNKYNKKCMPLIGPSSIGSVSYMFAKFGPFKDVDDFIDNCWTNLDLYDKNPINCEYGRDKDYLYDLTLKYSALTGEDQLTCWKDLLFHSYYQTLDGKTWERNAINSISKINGFSAEYADHVNDYGYSIDLFLNKNGEKTACLQVKPISSFCTDTQGWEFDTRLKLYKNMNRAIKKYNLPVYYLIYDSKRNGWLKNEGTNNSFWDLTKIVDVKNSFKLKLNESKTPYAKCAEITTEIVI